MNHKLDFEFILKVTTKGPKRCLSLKKFRIQKRYYATWQASEAPAGIPAHEPANPAWHLSTSHQISAIVWGPIYTKPCPQSTHNSSLRAASSSSSSAPSPLPACVCVCVCSSATLLYSLWERVSYLFFHFSKMPVGSRGAYTFVDVLLAIILPPLGVFLKYGLRVSFRAYLCSYVCTFTPFSITVGKPS
jgi:uncharacterized membrane protein YqaE (UPF0057 family)